MRGYNEHTLIAIRATINAYIKNINTTDVNIVTDKVNKYINRIVSTWDERDSIIKYLEKEKNETQLNDLEF